jgi:molybdopterin-guanine dinucleotide biosynthesis protein A
LHPDRLLISGPARKEWEECEVVSDEVADAGPLAGVSAALRTCATPLLVVLAIDLPLMTAEYLSSLLAISGSEQGVVPVSFRGPEPLAAIYPLGTLPLAQATLESGDYSMRGFVAKASAHGLLRSQPIAPNELKLFTNLNTVSDYERARPRTLD